MSSSEREQLRKVFFEAWRKYNASLPIEPLEGQVVEIILMHPEYQDYLSQPETYQDKDFEDANPFLHMSLHMSIRDQISTNRPQGIVSTYQKLCNKLSDFHLAEHLMMDCLAETLWQAQQNGIIPDEKSYLEQLNEL